MRNGQVVGSAALEIDPDGALLRSVAVAPHLHARGIGHLLTDAALGLPCDRHMPVYLLTTTAERFSPKFGFERVDRSEVPASLQSSVEFASACPSTATLKRRTL